MTTIFAIFRGRAGNAFLMLMPIIMFLLIVGYAMIFRTKGEHTLSFRIHRQNVATYLSEGIVTLGMEYIRSHFEDPKLKKDFISGTIKLVDLYVKYPQIKKDVDALIGEMPGSKFGRLTMDLVDVTKFNKLQKDPNEKGGTLVFTCQVSYYDVTTTLKVTRDIKVVNVAPPAEDFTFYTNQPQKNDREINLGAVITCLNKDKDSSSVGSIRIKGDNIIHLGDRYAWKEQNTCPMPDKARYLFIRGQFLGVPISIPPAIAALLKPFLETVGLSANDALISPTPLVGYPEFVNGGVPVPKSAVPQTGGGTSGGTGGGGTKASGTSAAYNPENGKGKILLFGKYNVGPGSDICLPKKLYGSKLKKLYGKYKVVEKVEYIPNPAPPPVSYKLFFYTTEPKCQEPPVIEPYGSADGSFKAESDESFGSASPGAAEYKKRAFFCLPELNMTTLKMFENGDSYLIDGVLFTNKAEIGSEKEEFLYNGRAVICSDNTMVLNNHVKIKKENAKKIPSNLSLVLHPKAPNALGYKKQKKSIDVEANVYSYNSLKYAGSGSSMTTYFNIYGNFIVDHLNIREFLTHLNIYFRKRLDASKDEQYTIHMSPICSSWFEEKKDK